MGLGLYGRIPNKGMAADPVAIQSIGREFAEASGLRNFFVSRQSDDWAGLHFHPAAEMIECLFEGDYLTLSAKTSSVGPGYHRLVVQFMDRLTARFGGTWTNEEADVDETGFLQTRDFGRLQIEMQNFLQALLRRIAELPDMKDVVLNMPMGLMPRHAGVASPMGDWPVETLREVAENPQLAQSFAQEFYPWWDEGVTARTLRNLALVSMWLNLPWRPPANPHEEQEIEAVLEALTQARALDKGLLLPETAAAELSVLLKGEEIDLSIPGVGYRRRICRHDLTGNWSAEFEGYFQDSDEDGTLCFWYGDRAIWFTSFSVQPAREANLARLLGNDPQPDVVVEHDGIAGYANTERKDDHFSMSCKFEAPGSVAMMTLVFASAADQAWAEAVFRSLRYLPALN